MSEAADYAIGLALGRIGPGFADPVRDAQASFRAILDATAHPGRIVTMPQVPGCAQPAPLGVAAAGAALTLCDIDTPVWLDAKLAEAAGYISFHCGTPVTVEPAGARFAFAADPHALPALHDFDLGTDEYPDRSATLIIEVAGLAAGSGLILRGPGTRGEAKLAAAGLPARFWEERAALAVLFPRGLDLILVCGDRLAALPRSTRIAW